MRYIFILITVSFLFAQSFTKSGMPFIRMGQSAYNLALGNAGVAGNAHSGSFFYNSAGLVQAKKDFVSANIQLLSQDRKLYSLAYTRAIKTKSFFSVAWIHATVDELYQFNNIAEQGDEIDYSDNAFLASLGFKFGEKLSLSLTAKYIVQAIANTGLSEDYDASAVAIDISAFYNFSESLKFGLVVKDLAREIKTNSEKITEVVHSEELPKSFVFGINTDFISDYFNIKALNLMIDYSNTEAQDSELNFGLEYLVYEGQSLRIGLENTAFRAGFGTQFEFSSYSASLDYAYLHSNIEAGSSHILSWMIEL